MHLDMTHATSTPRIPGRQPLTIAVGLALAAALAALPAAAADYFTPAEIDQIREAQEIERRIPVFLEIAEIRLAMLGLIEVEEPEEEGDGGFARAIIGILSPDAKEQLERAEEAERRPEFANDLTVYTRGELLRGYYQAIEEAMDNIDDAWERGRGDVRPPIESLKEFVETTIPILEEYAPRNADEEVALEDAIDIAELAREGADAALEVVPKTEDN